MDTENTTKDELYERATELDIDGRSTMDKDELAAAVDEAERQQREADAGAPPGAGDIPGIQAREQASQTEEQRAESEHLDSREDGGTD